MSSLLKELEALNAPVAEIPDLEDYNFDNIVKSKSRPADVSDEEMDQDEVVIQRRRITGAVELNDARYKGEKVSRADMFGDSSEMNGLQARKKKRALKEDSDEEEDEDDDDEDASDEGEDEDEEESDDDDIQLDELNKDDDDMDDDDDDDNSGEEEEEEEEEDEDDGVSKISMKELVKPIEEDEERKKGESVRKQMDMCEQILLLNIKSHGAMRSFNQLPRGEKAKELVSGADEKTRAALNEAHKNALKLVATLLEAEKVLLGGSNQTKELLKAKKEGEQNDAAGSDDEEIESSEDEDEEKGGMKKKNGVMGKKGQKKSADEDEEMDDYDDDDGSIPDYNVSGTDDSEDDDAEENGEGENKSGKKVENLRGLRKQCIASEVRFEKYRSSTLQKWDGRMRLSAVGGAAAAKQKKGDFSAFEGDILAQIEKILSDKRRLIARTQSKRSDHERIGGDPEATHDVEIFDDDDFYQVLLRDLIERKQAVDTNDPIAMSRQWLEIEKLRQKRKKKHVDTRASKGRKVRYTVIPKLVNFFAAVPECVSWTHEMRNELFKSLFK